MNRLPLYETTTVFSSNNCKGNLAGAVLTSSPRSFPILLILQHLWGLSIR